MKTTSHRDLERERLEKSGGRNQGGKEKGTSYRPLTDARLLKTKKNTLLGVKRSSRSLGEKREENWRKNRGPRKAVEAYSMTGAIEAVDKQGGGRTGRGGGKTRRCLRERNNLKGGEGEQKKKQEEDSRFNRGQSSGGRTKKKETQSKIPRRGKKHAWTCFKKFLAIQRKRV